MLLKNKLNLHIMVWLKNTIQIIPLHIVKNLNKSMRLMKYYQMKPLKNSMMEKCWEGENHPILTAKIHSPKMNKEDKNNKKNKEKKRGKDNKSMSNIEQPKQKILKQNLTMSIPIKK